MIYISQCFERYMGDILNSNLCNTKKCLYLLFRVNNKARGQSSVRTIVSIDNCQCGQLSGGHLSGRTFVQENYFKTYHVGYRWKGLDCNIVNLPFILVVDKFKIKRKTKICKKLIFDKLSLF